MQKIRKARFFRVFLLKCREIGVLLRAKAITVKIWIDADAAPSEVKQIVLRAAKRLGVTTLLVANRVLDTPASMPMVRSILVREGADEADKYIVAHAAAGDLAITADLPLAGQLVERGLFVIDPRGAEYSPDTIAARLSMRNFLDNLRGEGMVISGSAPYRETDKQLFASTFDRLLTKAIKKAKSTSTHSSPNPQRPQDDP